MRERRSYHKRSLNGWSNEVVSESNQYAATIAEHYERANELDLR